MPKYGENIYHRKDGRWEARYIFMRLPNGKAKYKSVYGKTHDIAKEKQLAGMLALHAGLRVGEVCALRASDIDFLAGTIHVCRSVQRITLHGVSRLLVQRPKSDSSERIVPLHPELLLLLRKYTAGMQPDAYIMTDLRDRPMDPRTCQYQFTMLLKRCGIRHRGVPCPSAYIRHTVYRERRGYQKRQRNAGSHGYQNNAEAVRSSVA